MDSQTTIANLALEYWKLLRMFDRVLPNYPPDKQLKLKSQVKYAKSRLDGILEEVNMRLMVYDGETYSPNLPVTVLNLSEYGEDNIPVIEQTLSPTIVCDGKIILMGQVVLEEKGED